MHRTNTIQLRLVIVVALEPKRWIVLIQVLIPLSYLLFVCADQLGFWETAHLPLPQANINTSPLWQNDGLGEG